MKILKKMEIKFYQHGFSLLEIMVVLAVIVVIASLGIPSYRHYVMKARRSEAHRILNQILIQAERFYNENNSRYPINLAHAYGNLPLPRSEFYTFTLINPCSNISLSACIEVQATAIGAQANDLEACRTLMLDTMGRRSPNLPECWNQ